MVDIEKTLDAWRGDLMTSIPVGGLISRNPIAYKWKSSFRCWMLREAVAWRLMDLMTQAQALQKLGHTLGARILVRSSFETLATLIYLNQMMEKVLNGEMEFQAFGDETSVLLLGSRTNPDGLVSRNIATVLQKCEKSYPGLSLLYADLSESAHPSYEDLARGYSKINHDDYETHFSNRWSELYGDRFQDHGGICLETFQYEYSHVWPERMDRLEAWIEINDEALEAENLLATDRVEPSLVESQNSKVLRRVGNVAKPWSRGRHRFEGFLDMVMGNAKMVRRLLGGRSTEERREVVRSVYRQEGRFGGVPVLDVVVQRVEVRETGTKRILLGTGCAQHVEVLTRLMETGPPAG